MTSATILEQALQQPQPTQVQDQSVIRALDIQTQSVIRALDIQTQIQDRGIAFLALFTAAVALNQSGPEYATFEDCVRRARVLMGEFNTAMQKLDEEAKADAAAG